MVRRRAAYERRHNDDCHLQRLDLGSRQRVRLCTVNTNIVKMFSLPAATTLNTINEHRTFRILIMYTVSHKTCRYYFASPQNIRWRNIAVSVYVILSVCPLAYLNKSSSRDEIANVNFLRRYCTGTSKYQKREPNSFNKQALLCSIELGHIKCNLETAKTRRNKWQLYWQQCQNWNSHTSKIGYLLPVFHRNIFS